MEPEWTPAGTLNWWRAVFGAAAAPRDPFSTARRAHEAHAATLAAEHPPTGGPARARRDPGDGAEVPWEQGRVTFPARITSHPTTNPEMFTP